MTPANPARAAVVKITDPHGDVQYLHYLHGWHCTFGWNRLCSGIDEKQIKALRFALDQCQHPNLVLAAVRRYGSSKFSYELDADTQAFEDRLEALAQAARDQGYVVVVIGPDEIEGVDRAEMEHAMRVEGGLFIDDNRDDNEDDEEE
jgi:hypothetical protein